MPLAFAVCHFIGLEIEIAKIRNADTVTIVQTTSTGTLRQLRHCFFCDRAKLVNLL